MNRGRYPFEKMAEPTRKLVLLLKEETHYWVNPTPDIPQLTDKYVEAIIPPPVSKHGRAQSLDLTENITYGKHRTSRSIFRPVQWRNSLPYHSPPSRGSLVIVNKVQRTPDISFIKENRVLPQICTMTQSRPRLPFATIQHPHYSKIKREASPEDFGRNRPVNPKMLKEGDLKREFDKMWAREVRLLKK